MDCAFGVNFKNSSSTPDPEDFPFFFFISFVGFFFFYTKVHDPCYASCWIKYEVLVEVHLVALDICSFQQHLLKELLLLHLSSKISWCLFNSGMDIL